MAEYSYKQLLDKKNQDAIRERLLVVNRKIGLSIAKMATQMGISPTTLRSLPFPEIAQRNGTELWKHLQ